MDDAWQAFYWNAEQASQNIARDILQRYLTHKNHIVEDAAKQIQYHHEKIAEHKDVIDKASVEAQQLDAALAKNGWSVA